MDAWQSIVTFAAGALVALVAHGLAERRARTEWRNGQAHQAATDLVRASAQMAFHRLEGSNHRESLSKMYVADAVVRALFRGEAVELATKLAYRAVEAAEARESGASDTDSPALSRYFAAVDEFMTCVNQQVKLDHL